MQDQPIASTILCTQCGGELYPEQGQVFITCPYCSSTVYLDKTRVVFHWVVAPTLDLEKARGALARWMAGNQTVKDLDKKATLTGSSFEYFPVWYFKRRLPSGKEQIILEPAAATSISEVRKLRLPAGDLRKYDPSLEAETHPPSVPLQAALGWLAEQKIPETEINERMLVHVPIFIFKYTFEGKTFTAIVEAASGEAFANIFPAKAEAPYQAVGGLAAVIFLCLATFPVVGAISAGEEGVGIGLLACSGLGIVATPLLFALAAWVTSKV